jgi:hypothetical protein
MLRRRKSPRSASATPQESQSRWPPTSVSARPTRLASYPRPLRQSARRNGCAQARAQTSRGPMSCRQPDPRESSFQSPRLPAWPQGPGRQFRAWHARIPSLGVNKPARVIPRFTFVNYYPHENQILLGWAVSTGFSFASSGGITVAPKSRIKQPILSGCPPRTGPLQGQGWVPSHIWLARPSPKTGAKLGNLSAKRRPRIPATPCNPLGFHEPRSLLRIIKYPKGIFPRDIPVEEAWECPFREFRHTN